MIKKRKTISFAQNIKQDIVERDIAEVLSAIKSDENLRTKIEQLRSFKEEKAQKKFKEAKLTAFNVARFNGSKRRCEEFKEAEYLLFDIDHIENAQELKSRIEADKRTAFYFISPRGNGLKFAFKLDKC